MKNWSRITPFETQCNQEETWLYKDGKIEKRFDVQVELGKPIDILSLKLSMLEDFRKNTAKIRDSRIAIYKKTDMQYVENCPVCENNTQSSCEVLQVYGAKYFRCENCSHYFVIERPSKKALEEFYAKDNQYQNTYADSKTTETRIKEVAVPKVKWLLRQFERVYGRKPKSVLDVGAGSGHFVQACKVSGIEADGIELSDKGRLFCKENFGIELLDKDFAKGWESFTDYEVITFWGVIEHVSHPMEMLTSAAKALSKKDGLIVVEVPRWSCFSTTVQSAFSGSIVRHLEPLGHINCFSDSSLATAFLMSGFDITAAWYFGMDAYELITQTSNLLNDNSVLEKMGENIPAFQKTLDLARLSDEVVFSGKPSDGSD